MITLYTWPDVAMTAVTVAGFIGAMAVGAWTVRRRK